MFDWFKDLQNELSGIDSTAARKEQSLKNQNNSEKFIFSKTMKSIIIALGILYLFMVGTMIFSFKVINNSLFYFVKYIVLSVIVLVVIISLVFGGKKGEIIAGVGSCLFLLLLYLSLIL